MSLNKGGRPRKLDINLTPDSLSGVLKNIWNEVEETKRIALQTFNKQQREVKELNDISLVGKINNDYLKIASEVSGKKLELAKLIQTYIQKDAKPDDSTGKGAGVVSSEDKATISAMIEAAKKTSEKKVEEEHVPSPKEIQEHEDREMDKIMHGESSDSGSDGDITDADEDYGF